MKIKPLFDRVVLKQDEAKEQNLNGIIIPSSVQEKPQIGEVVAVGDGVLLDGQHVPMQVKVGDRILYPKFSGSEYKLGDELFTILKQTDILAVLEK